MSIQIFQDMYQNLHIPMIVCRIDEEFTIVFANTSAMILLNPSLSTSVIDAGHTPLAHLLRFEKPGELLYLQRTLQSSSALGGFCATLRSAEDTPLQVMLHANPFRYEGGSYCIVSFSTGSTRSTGSSGREGESHVAGGAGLLAVLNASFQTNDIDEAISAVLAIAGSHMDVSRVYIFEFIAGDSMRNTYEWCAPGIAPAIDELQDVDRKIFSFNSITGASGMYISDDIRRLPDAERAFFELQGIKSLAILPLYHVNEGLGYIGFDDCTSCRKWTHDELRFLQSINGMVASMIHRRNAEIEVRRSREILQTVTDNADSIVYVSDLKTYEIKFINQALATMLAKEPGEIIGKLCWQVLQKDQTGPCPFCPIPKLLSETGEPMEHAYEWEFQNTVNERWYYAKDSLIKWIDDQYVHIETAIDITFRKRYEGQLQFFASTDVMTGVYNREWGYKLLMEAHQDICDAHSIIFIDIDGLKIANDTYGHSAGDQLIRDIIQCIRSCVRKDDVLCRWGGDEFIMLLRCAVPDAGKIVRKIQQSLARQNQSPERRVPLSFSFGIADLNAYPTIDAAVKAADERMYEDKERKRAQNAAKGR